MLDVTFAFLLGLVKTEDVKECSVIYFLGICPTVLPATHIFKVRTISVWKVQEIYLYIQVELIYIFVSELVTKYV